MNERQTHAERPRLSDVVDALLDPVTSLDVLLGFAEPAAVTGIRDAVVGLASGGDAVETGVLRVLTSLRSKVGDITRLAGQAGVSKPAISQRRDTKAQQFEALRNNPVITTNAFVELWRRRAARAVCVADLPAMLQPFLALPGADEPWGCNLDLAHVLICIAIGNPEVIDDGAATDESNEVPAGDCWLVDRSDASKRASNLTTRDFLETLADGLCGDSVRLWPRAGLYDGLQQAGIAEASTERAIALLQDKPVRRLIGHNDRVLVMSRQESKRARDIVRHVMKYLDLDDIAAIELVAHQQRRRIDSVRLDMRSGA